MKETTLTVNKKGSSYGFRRGNNYFTVQDVNYYQKVNAIRGRGITPDCEQKIRSRFPNVIIEFINDERRI
jgi:hypothetical protein